MAPAGAAVQSGLVNVAVEDNNVIVNPEVGVQAQVPIGVAANVCDVSAAVLAEQIDAGPTTCDSTTNQRTQQGLAQIQRWIANAG